MANYTPTPRYVPIPLLDADTVALGGLDGPSNLQAQALADAQEFVRRGLVYQKFDNTFMLSIGGYPLGSRILLEDKVNVVISTIAGNTNNPNAIMTGWTFPPSRTADVNSPNGQNQAQINDRGGQSWYAKPGGYLVGERVVLATGVEVICTSANNTNDPNAVMTGWEPVSLYPLNNFSDVPDKDTARTNLDVYSTSDVDAAISSAIPPVTPNASETVAGKAEIATQTETKTATDDSRIITPKKLLAGVKNHLNATGDAPISACRARVAFNATSGGVTILNSLNVSSVVRTATGKYIINFATPLPTANYALMGLCSRASTSSTNSPSLDASVVPTPTSVGIMVNNTSSGVDLDYVSIGVFC